MAARIDHRSYKEQGIDLIPTIHEGYEVRAMEKRGIKTVIGELNRAIRQFNQMFISLKESIQWMKTAYEEMKAELDRRQNPTLLESLQDYYDKKTQGRPLLPNFYAEMKRRGKNLSNLQEFAKSINYLQTYKIETMEDIEPFNVIYQTAEDGMGDTIKPRLVEAGADLSRVMVIDDTEEALTLSDDRIEKAVRQNHVRLVIIDPVQAFIGADVDMNRANEVRPVFRKLGMIAEKTGCAIVLIGHLNKSSGTQSTYRGLGSIDIMAAVRSLLFIGKVKKDPTTRVLIHEKSSLAPPGETMAFKLGDEEGFRWVGAYEISADDLLDGKEGKPTETKLQRGTKLIYELLADGNAVTIRELDEKAKAQGISQRTMREARSRMKEELDYRMNEKQENTIRLKKQGRMGDGRILE